MAPIAVSEAGINPKFMFSNEGVDELIPPAAFDYKTYDLQVGEVHKLIERVTEALINIKDATGRFSYKSGSRTSSKVYLLTGAVADGRVIDSITWNFWEWPQAIGLNGLFEVSGQI
jgi:hypothetical protein